MPRMTPTRVVGDPLSVIKINKINDDLDVLYSQWSDRLKVWAAWGLDITIWWWVYNVWWSIWQYAWWTVTLTDNATNYIMITAGWSINVSTSWRNANYLRIATVTTLAWSVTAISIWRVDAVWWLLGGWWFKNISSTVYNYKWNLTSFIADWVSYTLTYDSYDQIRTITNWWNTRTMTYDQKWNLLSTVES